MSNTAPVDFALVKRAASIESVLEYYAVKLQRRGRQLSSCCPVHNGSNARSFVVNPHNNTWHCFGDCRSGGDVIKLVSLIENITAPEAARLIAARLGISAHHPRTNAQERSNKMSGNAPSHKVFTVEGEGDEAFWTRVGSAWPHKDGKGFNITLSALPVNGRIVLREPQEADKQEEAQTKKGRR